MSSDYKFVIDQSEFDHLRFVTGEIAIVLSIDEDGQRIFTYKYGPDMSPIEAIGLLEGIKTMIIQDLIRYNEEE